MKICFDVETSTKNHGNPHTHSNSMVSYSIKTGESAASFNHVHSPDFLEELRSYLPLATLCIGFNLKFDLHWAARYQARLNNTCRIWDCQIAEFIISGQQHRMPSLNECLEKYGLGQKDDKIAEYWKLGVDTIDIPVHELEKYNNLDVELTYQLYQKQMEIMKPEQIRLCLVMGLDLKVLQEMEFNGIKFDTALCATKAEETRKQLLEITEQLLAYSPSPDINLDSGQHLSCLLFGGKFEVDYVTEETAYYKSGKNKGQPYLKNRHNEVVYSCQGMFKPLPKTETKLAKELNGETITIYATNEGVLRQLKATSRTQKTVISLLLARAELAKLLDTYYGKLPNLLETMEWGSYIHGQYNQCVAATGRLSSSGPNMQNFSGEVDALLVSRYD